MSKHTTGPFNAVGEAPAFIVAGESLIATVHSMVNEPNAETITPKECLANAHLFAAAPNMLKALRLHHDDGMDGALLIVVAERLRALAGDSGVPTFSAARMRRLADMLAEKHNAACAAIAEAEAEQTKEVPNGN